MTTITISISKLKKFGTTFFNSCSRSLSLYFSFPFAQRILNKCVWTHCPIWNETKVNKSTMLMVWKNWHTRVWLQTHLLWVKMNEKASKRSRKKTHSNYDIETANESATVQSNTKNELQFCAQLMTFLFQCKMVSLTLSKSQSNDFAFQINAIELGVCRSEDRLCECVRASMYFHSNGILASLGI